MVKTLDSGKRDEFKTGARRDTQDDKPRFDLLSPEFLVSAQKYFSGNDYVPDKIADPITRREFESEVRRDLIPDLLLNRLGALYKRGAAKYSDNNWQKGIPLSRLYSSLFRHLIAWRMGDTTEDHLAAIVWNAAAIMWTENAIVEWVLLDELADIGPLTNE